MSLDEEWGADEPQAKAPPAPDKDATEVLPKAGLAELAPPAELPEATPRPGGTPLRELIAGKRLEQQRALSIARGVLEALATVHTGNKRHGDIAPETIVILPGLGLDRVKLSEPKPKPAGDPKYNAPETAFGAADGRADIYSVGAVLFELLTGHPPFFADNANELRRLHAYAPPQTLKQRAPNLSFAPALEDIVDKALQKKRDARYQTATEMMDAVDSALMALEAATPAPAPTEAQPKRKQNDSLLLLAKDLMPQPSAALTNEPLVPVNVDRKVPELPMSMRARNQVRRGWGRVRPHVDKLVEKFRALDRKLQIGIGAGAAVLVLVLAIVTCGGGSSDKPKPTAAAPSSGPLVESSEPPAAGEAIDPVASWAQALDEAKTCDERSAAIAELANSGDERALPALKKAKAHKCVAKEATAAIQKISAKKR